MSRANRGEVWIVDLGLAAKVRPCLIFSVPFSDQERSLVTVVAHTTSACGGRFEVPARLALIAGCRHGQHQFYDPDGVFIDITEREDEKSGSKPRL